MEGSILSTLAEWTTGDDWADDEHPVQLSTPEHYSEAQRRVVEGPMFDLLRRLAITEMTSYAADHALIDFLDPIPPSVYALRWYHKLTRYPRLRLQEAMGSNPYRVPWYVYVLCTGMLIGCLVIKAVVIDRLARMPVPCAGVRWGVERERRARVCLDQSRVWDTLAGVLPIVVTFVLFLFPPLLAKT